MAATKKGNPGNTLKESKRLQIEAALDEGLSIGAVSRMVRVAPATVRKYLDLRGGKRGRCGCGGDPSHKGFCSYLYLKSAARQAFMESWVPVRTQSHWPYVATALEDDLVAEVNRCVPREHLFVEVREEVCQDLCVAVLSGELQRSEIAGAVSQFTKAVMRRYPSKYGPLSLDQPVRKLRHGGTVKLSEVIPNAACEAEFGA